MPYVETFSQLYWLPPLQITMWKIVNYNPCLITDLLYYLRMRTPLCGLYFSVCRLEILNSFLFDLESVFCHIYQMPMLSTVHCSVLIWNLPWTCRHSWHRVLDLFDGWQLPHSLRGNSGEVEFDVTWQMKNPKTFCFRYFKRLPACTGNVMKVTLLLFRVLPLNSFFSNGEKCSFT